MGGSGIYLIESNHATVNNNIISGTDVSIYPIGLEDFTITNNQIYEGVSEGIALDMGLWTGKKNRNGIISNNISERAMEISSGENIIVSDNVFNEQNIAGLSIGQFATGDSTFFEDSSGVEDIIITGNTINRLMYIGYSSTSGSVSNATKFYAKNVSVLGNTINCSGAGGIYLFTGDNINIKNNTIIADSVDTGGLIASFTDSVYLKNIYIENNILIQKQDTANYGIRTMGYPLYIKNNILTGNYTTGIYVTTQEDKLDSVYISNNIVSGSLTYANGTPTNMWNNIASNINPGSQIFQDSYIFSNTLNIDTTIFSYGYAIVQVWGDTDIDSITTKPSGSILYLKFQDTLTVNNATKNIKLRTTDPYNYTSTSLSTLTLISNEDYWWEIARTYDGSYIGLPDTAGITTGFIPKRQADGSIEWEADDAGGTGDGTVTSVAAITLGTTGTDLSSTVANGTTTPVITLQVPTASATNRGALSSTDWSTFNNKPDSDAVNGLIGDWADSTASDTSAYTMDEIDSLLALVGKVQTHTITTDSTLAAGLMYGGIFYVTEAQTITLPAVAEGMNAVFITVGNVAVSIDVNGSDLMYLDGTALSDGDKATNTSTTGDMIVFTYFSSVGWYATSGSNDGDRWTDGN